MGLIISAGIRSVLLVAAIGMFLGDIFYFQESTYGPLGILLMVIAILWRQGEKFVRREQGYRDV